MPTISVKRDALFEALGKTYTDEEFQDVCFEFGLELDEVTTEKQMLMKEQGEHAGAGTSEEILYRIDIPANRYDLLCLEGLVNGLLVFQGKIAPPEYRLSKWEDGHSLHVTPATAQIRPYAVAAVLRNISFTKQSYDSFIDLQDKLHQNICRKRTLVAIGTHDLDTVQGPFVYDALPPEQIRFKALNQQADMTATQLMELYAHHPQLKQYLGIIKDSPVYPVIKDKNGVVLSMPPIINGDHSKITLDTKNVFIECTATDLTKASIVLETIVCLFSSYCSQPFYVQPCKVYAPEGHYELTPRLSQRLETVDVQRLNQYIGIECSGEELSSLLTRMCLPTEPLGSELRVRVPPTRRDVIHAADIYEDAAIAFGYNNIPRREPRVVCVGKQSPLNKLTELVRHECARAGLTEALTFTLCSRDDVSTKLSRPASLPEAVHISNPKTLEFQVCRTLLLPGLLKTLASNKGLALPLRLFEISDVVLRDDKAECGSRNVRRVCVAVMSRSACFERVAGLLEHVLRALRVTTAAPHYRLRRHDEAGYLAGRCAVVEVHGQGIGTVGVLHPLTLAAFELPHPVTALEIDLEPFL